MSDHDGLGPEGSYFENKARREEEARRARGDAMFPVWITALYLLLGFVFGLWHPGWLLFLTIPIHYMHFDSQICLLYTSDAADDTPRAPGLAGVLGHAAGRDGVQVVTLTAPRRS